MGSWILNSLERGWNLDSTIIDNGEAHSVRKIILTYGPNQTAAFFGWGSDWLHIKVVGATEKVVTVSHINKTEYELSKQIQKDFAGWYIQNHGIGIPHSDGIVVPR